MAKYDDRFFDFKMNETRFLDLIEYNETNSIELQDFSTIHISKGIPFVYRNLAFLTFPSFKVLQDEGYWLSRIKNEKIKTERKPKFNNEFAYFAKNFSSIEMTYEELVSHQSNYENEDYFYYWAEQPLPNAMIQDVRDPEFTTILNLEDIFVWKGKGGTISLAHTDDRDNLICQVTGYKEFILAPFTQSYYVYSGEEGYPKNYSPVNFYNPDLSKHPLFNEINGKYYIKLNEGDCLFIPVQWWHHVKSSKESNLAINFFFTANYDSINLGKLLSDLD